MSKVSVITPVYKTEDFLDKSLPSLTAQTLADIELVWIDNGASDECRRLMDKYATDKVKIIRLPENIGYMGAINAGLNAATGDYVGFCDSDDWVDTDYYENLYKTAETENADVVLSPYILEKSKTQRIVPLLCDIPPKNAEDLFETQKYGCIWNGLYRRSMIENHRIRLPDGTKSIFRDNLFFVQAALYAGKSAVQPKAGYHYVLRSGSTTQGIDRDVRKNAAMETLTELSRIVPADLMQKNERGLSLFLARSLGISVLDKNQAASLAIFETLPSLAQIYTEIKSYKDPTIGQRLFSISRNPEKKRVKIRFLGFAVSFKYKYRKDSK